MKGFFAKNFARNYEKKILETSDAWSMSCLSNRPSDPVYHIEDCRISGLQLKNEICSREIGQQFSVEFADKV